MLDDKPVIKRGDLHESKPQDVVRLAKYLGLHVNDKMSHRNISNLVYWRLTRKSR